MPLNPCPFCASKKVQPVFNGTHYFVQCFSCHATGPQVPSFEDDDLEAKHSAVQKWSNDDNSKKVTYPG